VFLINQTDLRMLKKTFFISLFILSVIIVDAQRTLTKIPITKDDELKGVISKYIFIVPKGYHHVETILTLFKNGNYEYFEADLPQSYYSAGKWKLKNKNLILNSDLQQNEVPIKIEYLTDSSVNKITKIGEIQDPKYNSWAFSHVLINNDSTICFPASLYCKGSYTKIDSIKVLFGDRMSSKWIKVKDDSFQKLQLILDIDENIMAYIPMCNKYFAIKGNSILINWRPLPKLLSTPVYP